MNFTKAHLVSATAGLLASAFMATAGATGINNDISKVIVGKDNNSFANPVVQPQDPALAGGGRDQSLRFGDVLIGGLRSELMIGNLGNDTIAGGFGNEVIIGGLEHFTEFDAEERPLGRQDRAFGGPGHDVFLWKPGDASDFFDGGRGRGQDAIVFGLVGENTENGVEFAVVNDGQAGDVFIDPKTNLPLIDVTNLPGFCEVIDRNTSPEAHEALKDLDLDHLVRFSLRGVRDAFEAGEQSEDNGLRVTLHLKDVEVLVCASRDGGQIEVLDLKTSPPSPISVHDLKPALRDRLNSMVR